MEFNEKLKMLRKKNNLTQEELSSKLNVSRQAITKWETGEGIPDIENIKQISNLFNISIDELVKEDKNITIESKKKYTYLKELDIDHNKHFDINISRGHTLNIKNTSEEKVIIELLSDEIENIEETYKIKLDDLYNRLDIDIKTKIDNSDLTINMYIPEKYINEMEINSKLKYLNISNITFANLEYDGELKYLNVTSSKGDIVLNVTKSDVEIKYDTFLNNLEINTINSLSYLSIPKESKYKTIIKGKANEIINATISEESENIIELNGINSKLIIKED